MLIWIDDVSTRRTNDCYREDLDLHIGSTQNELDQLKDILNGCNNFDANTLLGVMTPDINAKTLSNDKLFLQLFSENDTFNDAVLPSKENPAIEGAPGNEEAESSNLLDFTELLDDDLNIDDSSLTTEAQASSTLNTPVRTLKNGPSFPVRS